MSNLDLIQAINVTEEKKKNHEKCFRLKEAKKQSHAVYIRSWVKKQYMKKIEGTTGDLNMHYILHNISV